jgi:hypothetical protein
MSNTIFLIGSGFTKSIFNTAPLNDSLLDDLKRSYPSESSMLNELTEKYKTTNIEILLTYLDIEISTDVNLSDKREKINNLLADYFKQYRFNNSIALKNRWLKTFAKDVLAKDNVIITLNYDCLLEGVLDFYEVWTPNNGYGCLFNPLADKNITKNPKDILIYKIHGSENFVLSSMADDKRRKWLSFEINSSLYPKSGLYKNFGAGIIEPQPYIIAPSFVKVPHSRMCVMMNELIMKVKNADSFIVVGCGLRPEDSYLRQLLMSFINVKRDINNKKNLVVVDPFAKTIIENIDVSLQVPLGNIVDLYPIECGFQSSIDRLRKHLGV